MKDVTLDEVIGVILQVTVVASQEYKVWTLNTLYTYYAYQRPTRYCVDLMSWTLEALPSMLQFFQWPVGFSNCWLRVWWKLLAVMLPWVPQYNEGAKDHTTGDQSTKAKCLDIMQGHPLWVNNSFNKKNTNKININCKNILWTIFL